MPSFTVLVVAVPWLSVVPVSLWELMITRLVSASSAKVLVIGLDVCAPAIVCLLVVVLEVLVTA